VAEFRMPHADRPLSPLLVPVIAALLIVVALVDVMTPLGVAEWVFYIAPVSLAMFASDRRLPFLVAGACTLLIAIGGYLSDPAGPVSVQTAVLNRGMAVSVIWLIAAAGWQHIKNRLFLAERDWLRASRTALAERLQGEQQLARMAEGVLRYLCEAVDAPVGVLYAAEDDGVLRRVAGHAAADGAGDETVAVGRGLVGQAAQNRSILTVRDVPAGHLPVTSGLGTSTPRQLVLVPATADRTVTGVIELGFLRPVEPLALELLETSAEPIGVALRSLHYRSRLETLLVETREQAERLHRQQEELRVVNEELEEQSSALRDSQERLESQQAELEQTNAQLEEQNEALEGQRDALARAQGQLVEKANELGRASQYKSEFLANMSHELRTPLNSALILSKLLADNVAGNLTDEQVQHAGTIHAAGNDLLALINDILDLSRIEAGRVDLQAETVQLSSVLESLRRTFRPLTEQKQLAFDVVEEAGTPAALVTDPLRLQQILRNLLSNAVRFTDRGSVTLTVVAADAERVAFTVADTGIGIDPDEHDRIFEAFHQGAPGGLRKSGGTGLGLTISRELARRLGGDVTLVSTPGQGSRFTLVLPIRFAEEAGHETPRPLPPETLADRPRLRRRADDARPSDAPAPPAPPARQPSWGVVDDDRGALEPGQRAVLIVEDDARFATILRDLAREQGFRCLVATSAAEGLALAREHLPSAILLDVQLPDDSGLTVLERLKARPATRHIPIHVVSVADYAQQALEMGAVGFAVKPVRREDLEDAFRRLTARIEQDMRRVLVVEDVEEQRRLIVRLLAADNVEVVAAGTANEALQALQAQSFDCMVLDLGLPDMTGFDLLERMTAEGFAFPPVIVYTAHRLTREEELALRRFAGSIVIKGVRSTERLLDEVTLFLHQVESRLPADQQRILRDIRNRDAFLEGRRVLLVEDDVRNVFALTSILEPRGAKLVIARNGREALTALAETERDGSPPIDLVLMDVMMPEMDGLTATRTIRRNPAWQKLPIIALTAKAMPDDREKCLDAGANDYITKPLDVDKLLSLVKVWMPK